MTDPKALTAEREAFEKHFTAAWLMRDGDTYKDVHADLWEGWQAALEWRATREQTASTGEPFGWHRIESDGPESLQPMFVLGSHPPPYPAKYRPLYAAPVEQAGSPPLVHPAQPSGAEKPTEGGAS